MALVDLSMLSATNDITTHLYLDSANDFFKSNPHYFVRLHQNDRSLRNNFNLLVVNLYST